MKKFFVASLILACMSLVSTSAFAYSTTGYKWSSANPINWYYDNYLSSATKNAASAAASAWNNVNYSKVKFSFVSGGKVFVNETNNSNVTWDGLTSLYADSGGKTITSANVTFNISKQNIISDSNAFKSVAVHEFGHVLGLYEYNGKVIMNPATFGTNSRYGTYGLTTPQTDDINGIKAIYP